MYDYLIGRAKARNIRRFIRFNTAVRHVDFDEEKKKFTVEVEDLLTNSTEYLAFDRVVVAIGHYHVPNMTNIDGVNEFPGRVLHSHDFRGADEFVGLNILIVGGNISAEDITLQCYKFGARSITISSRQKPVGLKWPDNIKEVPILVRMEGRKAHFKDGSNADNIDAIIFCTGYRHSYPFMARQLRLQCDYAESIPPNLYKTLFWMDRPHLAYLGATRYIFSFPIFEIQTALVCDVFLDHLQLPDKDQWTTDLAQWRARGTALPPMDIFAIIDLEFDYMRDMLSLLNTQTEHQSLAKFDFDQARNMFQKYLENKMVNVVNYRDIAYQSMIDPENTKLVPVCKPWMENMDQSLESFLSNYRDKV